MNILKFRDGYIGNPQLIYCGRPRQNNYYLGQLLIGLGNPYAWKPGTKAKFKVANLQESLECYRGFTWKLIKAAKDGQLFTLEAWEYHYFLCMEALAIAIKRKLVKGVVCFCVNIEDYTPNSNSDQFCHTQILLDACYWMIDNDMVDKEPQADLVKLWNS
ncbi:MAG TPA: hypothetical protein VK203_10810 [Nostocaceae cyanobacterium]|nr:hypothetical protein [Nostocaceae cyanobacterium]